MAYVGVEFLENGDVGLIHSSWLTPLKKEAFWPPYKTSNTFNKALTTPEEPNQSSWKIYPIKRLFFECDNIDKAKKKLKKCEETSDIYSSDSDLNSSLRVRKRFSTRRFISGCSSSEEDEPIGKLPRPPALLKPTEGGSNSHQISRQILSRTLTEESNKTRNTPNTPIINKNALLKTTFGSRENFSLSLTQEDDLTLTPNNGQVLNESNRSITVSANGLEKIFQEVKRLREELKEVKGFLIKSRNSSVVFSLPNDTPVEFPLTTIANLQTLEEYLSEEDKFNDLASYFSTLGGNATNTQVNKILRFVMSDSLATKYNFAGQRNKQAFGGTKINSVIIRAIQIKFPATTRADIENAVKTWLKHAKQRMEKKQKTILE